MKNNLSDHLKKWLITYVLHTLVCFASLIPTLNGQQFYLPQDLNADQYEANIILFKIKKSNETLALEALNQKGPMHETTRKFGSFSIRKNFPVLTQKNSIRSALSPAADNLSRVYEITFSENIDVVKICRLMQKSGLFDWVHPRYIAQPLFSPNDPQIGQQYHHSLIKAFDAWDIEQGDTNVIIGYTDAGIQFDHEDLGNVKYNYNDIINGIDDDQDGYIDNFRGWNVASNTNDPTAKVTPHGMFTAGLGSGVVNNAKGIAGVGFKCKFLPIRIDNSKGAFSYGYEGIIYAANMGCPIINASWGSTIYDPLGEDVINYALEKNCLVVAAAGNSGKQEKYYPASFPGVLSVAASGPADYKWPESTFSERVDIIAPGENLRSSTAFNKYSNSSGTSFSAPLVSGAAALVKSKFPELTPEQLKARLKNTADTSIYELPQNNLYFHLLGAGRLNIFKALTEPAKPSIKFTLLDFHDSDKDRFSEAGDTIRLEGYLENIMAPTKNLEVKLTCTSPYVEILSGDLSVGVLNTNEKHWDLSKPFTFRIKPNAPHNHDIFLKFNYSDSAYKAFEYVEMRVNKDYIELHNNRVGVTITSRGNIGYNGDFASEGTGFTHFNQQMIYYSGFLLGTADSLVADNAYGSQIPGYNNDFQRVNGVQIVHPENDSFRTVYSSFMTDSAARQRLLINHRATAYKFAPDDHYVIMEFKVKNIGNDKIDNLCGGIFTDWDIESSNNKAVWDSLNQLSYAFNTNPGGMYGGVCSLAGPNSNGYSFNSNGSDGSIKLTDGFTGAEKFRTLSGKEKRDISSIGDVSNMLGSQSISLQAGDSITFAYAMLAADSLPELIKGSTRAKARYNFIQLNSRLEAQPVSCNKTPGSVHINVNPTKLSRWSLSKPDGTILFEKENPNSNLSYENLQRGEYILRYYFEDNTSFSERFSIDTLPAINAIANSSEKFAPLGNATIQFTADATGTDQFKWDFKDGNYSDKQNTSHTFTKEGTYFVDLIAFNNQCADTVTLEINIVSTVGTEAPVKDELILFPNPAKDIIKVQSRNKYKKLPYKIYAVTGQLIQSGILYENQSSIDVSSLPDSIYLFEMGQGDHRILKTLVISR